jgi:hypothetical protein
MARNLTGAQIAEIQAQNMRPILLCQLFFTSGWVYLWSGIGSLSWNGQTWLGIGTLGTVSAVPETSDLTAVGLKFALSGVDPAMLTHALGEVRQGQPVILYQGFLTQAGGVVASPNTAWSGRMDTCEIAEGGETAVITLTAESRLLDLNRSRERRYEKQDQAIDFPGDLGFDYVPSLQELSVVWGKPSPTSAPTRAPGSGGGSAGGNRNPRLVGN